MILGKSSSKNNRRYQYYHQYLQELVYLILSEQMMLSTLLILLIPLLMPPLPVWLDHLYQQHFTTLLYTLIFIVLYTLYYLKFSKAHFLTKGVYQQSKKNLRKPPPPFPNGWYNVAKADEFQVGFVKPVDINGHNLVVFKGKDKVVYALEAYCLHMGAHLGVGGQVVNQNCIQCPFHGWLYDGKSGACVDHNGEALKLKSVEYNDDLCKKDGKQAWKEGKAQKLSLRKYPVKELNGYIYVWIHAVQQFFQKPTYPMIDVSSFINQLAYRGKTEHHIHCHMQDIPSNGADIAHFKYVHTYITPLIKGLCFRWDAKWKTGDDPEIKSLFEHPRKEIREFKQRIWREIVQPYPNKEILSIGSLQNSINIPLLGEFFMFSANIIQVGLGIVFIILKSPLYELVFHHYIRPEGRNFQVVLHDLFISNYIPYFASSIVCQLQGGQVTNDMYIWQSKSFARKTNLKDTQNDRVLRDWLKWSGQFYQGCSYQLQKDKYTW